MKEIHPNNQHPEFDNRPGAGHHPDGGHRPEKLWPIDKAKMEIIAVIRANGIRAITGPVLRHVLLHLADVVPVRLGELYDITLSEPKEGQQLEYDGEKWVNSDPLLSKLFDVLLDSQTNGQVLEWDAEKERWINADPRLSKLFDVLLGNPTKGQVLQWDGQKWVNADPVITGLFDSTVSSPEAGETLEYDGKNWKNAKPLLSKLFDVTISALENNNVLEYDSASGMWKNSSNFYTKAQIDEIIKNAISSVLRFQGTSSSQISDGSTTNPIVVNGKSVTVVQGDVVLYGNKEFVWTGSAWEELGDEASWALKTITITGTGYLTGGGNLSANRTIDLTQDAKTRIEHGESAYQTIVNGGGNKSYEEMTAAAYDSAIKSGGIKDGVLYVIIG